MATTDSKTAFDAIPDEFQESLTGDDGPTLEEILPPSFVDEYSESDGLDGLLAQWDVDSAADLRDVPLSELDDHVSANATFDSWAAMIRAGTDEFVYRSTGY